MAERFREFRNEEVRDRVTAEIEQQVQRADYPDVAIDLGIDIEG